MTPATTSPGDLRILVVEDHVVFAESLELALAAEGYDVRRVPVPPDDRSAAAYVVSLLRQRPHVVLLDLDLGAFGEGVRLVAPLARAGADVVAVTASADLARWGEAVRSGARKVLPTSRPLQEILTTVRRLHRGLPVMDPDEREQLLAHWQRDRAELQELQLRIELLTAREQQVLGHLSQGRSVREIAALGGVAEGTVRTQVKSIRSKLEVSSQLAAVGLVHRLGWSPQPPD